jgi:uncharacterized protein YegJ (DUF2314 family)
VSEPQSKVFLFDNDDPAMQRAYEQARATFRYFWREVAWERRRIVPALDLAAVKAPFSDGDRRRKDTPEAEHMWLSEVDFDGRDVSGVLINSPNWLTGVKEGDAVGVPLGRISDWMYAISGVVYGAFTVNLLRSRMGRKDLKEHDAAWGLNFGDPAKLRVAPAPEKGQPESPEHPMSVNMACSLKEQLAREPSLLTAADDRGWTLLHQEALAGSAPTVGVLLDAGADPEARTRDGRTALQLAQSLGWETVAALLARE